MFEARTRGKELSRTMAISLTTRLENSNNGEYSSECQEVPHLLVTPTESHIMQGRFFNLEQNSLTQLEQQIVLVPIISLNHHPPTRNS